VATETYLVERLDTDKQCFVVVTLVPDLDGQFDIDLESYREFRHYITGQRPIIFYPGPEWPGGVGSDRLLADGGYGVGDGRRMSHLACALHRRAHAAVCPIWTPAGAELDLVLFEVAAEEHALSRTRVRRQKRRWPSSWRAPPPLGGDRRVQRRSPGCLACRMLAQAVDGRASTPVPAVRHAVRAWLSHARFGNHGRQAAPRGALAAGAIIGGLEHAPLPARSGR
jgi:hypothetical protein